MEQKTNSDILKARQDFLDDVRLNCVDTDRTFIAYAQALDELLKWSESKLNIIELKPRGSDLQNTVRFRLVGTPRIFWAAYPRPTQKDAKLMAVQDHCDDLPDFIRDRIRDQFAELDPNEKSEKIPTISFQVLKFPPYRSKVITFLDQALADIQAHFRR